MSTEYRVSWLNSLAICPAFGVLSMAKDRESGKAADTGTGVGRGIELFHRAISNGAPVEEARLIAAQYLTLEHVANFPKADLAEVIRRVARYTEDERAYGIGSPFGVVEAELCEAEVRLTLAPDEHDPTGEPIKLVGHIDLPRRQNGVLRIWDVKDTQRYKGSQAVYAYAWQLAAYTLAAAETFGEPVAPGGIVLTRAYEGARISKKPASACNGVWIQAPFSVAQCESMMRQVAYQIGQIRAGRIASVPSSACTFCPGEGPHVCQRALSEIQPGHEPTTESD